MNTANLTKSARRAARRTIHQIARRPAGTARKANGQEHMLNLRCPKEGCHYFCKASDRMLKMGRLRCPIDRSILRTKVERGETRGRAIAA